MLCRAPLTGALGRLDIAACYAEARSRPCDCRSVKGLAEPDREESRCTHFASGWSRSRKVNQSAGKRQTLLLHFTFLLGPGTDCRHGT